MDKDKNSIWDKYSDKTIEILMRSWLVIHFIAIVTFILILYIVNEINLVDSSWFQVVDNNSKDIIFVAIRYAIYEIIFIFVPFIIYIIIFPNSIISKYISYISFGLIFFVLIMMPINKGLAGKLNILLEPLGIMLGFEKQLKRTTHYVKINNMFTKEEKISFIKQISGISTRTNHYISFDYLEKNRPIVLEVGPTQYEKTNVGEIYSFTPFTGFYGIEYLVRSDNMGRIDENKFPDSTQFPLTEEEAKTAMALKKAMDSKESQNNSK